MILYKNDGLKAEFENINSRLLKVVRMLEHIAFETYGDALLVTSIYRNDRTTHNCAIPYRFIDIAVLNNGGMRGSRVCRKALNLLFPYGKSNPRTGRSYQTVPPLRHRRSSDGKMMPPHFHVQVRA